MDDLAEMEERDVQGLFADSDSITLRLGPSNDDLMGLFEQMLIDDSFLQIAARAEAANEFTKPADLDARVEDALARLQSAGMATGAIEGALNNATERRRAIGDFNEQVLAALVARAETEGEEAVSNLAAYREVIRSLKSKEEYIELYLSALDGQADELNTIEDAGRIDGGEAGDKLENLAAALTDNGQIERVERLQMWLILQNAKQIYGE